MLEIGTVFDGKYKILSKVGQGGMSTVYLAINEKANKPWAIKEVRKDGIHNFEVVKQSLLIETDLLKNCPIPIYQVSLILLILLTQTSHCFLIEVIAFGEENQLSKRTYFA